MKWVYGILAALFLPLAGLVGFSWWTARRAVKTVPPTGQFMDVDGNRLHYIDEGSGPPILLIHGLGGHTRNFPQAVTGPLARKFRVIAVDRPGAGFSTRPFGTDAGLSHQAETIAHFVGRLGLKRPLIVGHSLGGALALALAIEQPQCVGGLALIAPLTQPTDKVPDAFRGLVVNSRLRRLVIAWTLAVPASLRFGADALRMVFGPDPVPADFATVGGGVLNHRPTAYYNTSTDLMAISEDLPRLASQYGSIRVPVGILFGDQDQILDHREHGAKAEAAIPGASLALAGGHGHMLPIVVPERTVAFIEEMAAKLNLAA